MSIIGKLIRYSFFLGILGIIVGALVVVGVITYYGKDLPDYTKLENYEPATVTRLYASDGRLIEEYAKEKRFFVPIDEIPQKVVQAFISAEDQNFYNHPGIDVVSIFRAMITNLSNVGKDKSLVGGSTITQQVVKNFLLTNEKSFERKIREAILSFRISNTYSKDKIMELYLNEIYLGNRAYGVAAAALNYFNKSLSDLKTEEAAMLAALPKAPSSLDPERNYDRALQRRNWVIGRMQQEGYISSDEASVAKKEPIKLADKSKDEIINNADSFAEAVRLELSELYSKEDVYEQGLNVVTTIDPELQKLAREALRDGLRTYDRRHGYKGVLGKVKDLNNYKEELQNFKKPKSIGDYELAVVLNVSKKQAEIATLNNDKGIIPLENLKWARKYINDKAVGRAIYKASDVLSKKDVIIVNNEKDNHYRLEQIPEVNGSIVVIAPKTGRVLAMVGGYANDGTQFNRAIQAKRQPGSAFKPFVYLTALENGYDPNSIIVDEEIKLYMGRGMKGWSPKNYSGRYYGPTTLRTGVEKSRNAMTVRLAQLVGIDKVIEMSERLGIYNNPPPHFSITLGAKETNLLNLTNAYAVLANGGKRVYPSIIEYIQNRNGKVIYKRDKRNCINCNITSEISNIKDIKLPILEGGAEQIIDPIANYQITSILEGVIQRGTGVRAKKVGKIIAGKTGTTNDSYDAWFMGYSPDLAVGVYVGFDKPRSLGKKETGASVALPIWIDFMKQALKNEPNKSFTRPLGVNLVQIDAKTGLLPSYTTPDRKTVFEAFRAGTEPTQSYDIMIPQEAIEFGDNKGDSEPAPIEVFQDIGIY